MGKDWEIACPKCGGHKLNTYRHMFAKLWCESCGFVLRDEGSITLNRYIPECDTMCTIMRATQVETQCPHCNKWNGGWIGNPRGHVDICSHCDNGYKVHPDADVELDI
jgi:predicted RNA-binding Zn-ribbon protein involved in translation (DUF1610 family)